MKYIVFDHDGTLVKTSTTPHPHLYPGIKELITDLARQHQLYVWTARGRFSTLRILKELGIVHFFEAICTIDDAPNKPHVAGLELLLGKTQRSSICMIGDTTNDILGGKNFGVKTIGAIWNGEANGAVLKDYGADFIVSHPSECSRIIELNLEEDMDV